jgi:hypothetical protein
MQRRNVFDSFRVRFSVDIVAMNRRSIFRSYGYTNKCILNGLQGSDISVGTVPMLVFVIFRNVKDNLVPGADHFHEMRLHTNACHTLRYCISLRVLVVSDPEREFCRVKDPMLQVNLSDLTAGHGILSLSQLQQSLFFAANILWTAMISSDGCQRALHGTTYNDKIFVTNTNVQHA